MLTRTKTMEPEEMARLLVLSPEGDWNASKARANLIVPSEGILSRGTWILSKHVDTSASRRLPCRACESAQDLCSGSLAVSSEQASSFPALFPSRM